MSSSMMVTLLRFNGPLPCSSRYSRFAVVSPACRTGLTLHDNRVGSSPGTPTVVSDMLSRCTLADYRLGGLSALTAQHWGQCAHTISCCSSICTSREGRSPAMDQTAVFSPWKWRSNTGFTSSQGSCGRPYCVPLSSSVMLSPASFSVLAGSATL